METESLTPPSSSQESLDLLAGNALFKNDFPSFLSALEQGANPHACFNQISMLTWACVRKCDNAFKKKLLELGASPNDSNIFWHFMLYHVKYGDMKTILKKWPYEERLNEKKQTALEFTLKHSIYEPWKMQTFKSASLLLEKGASWKIQEGKSTLMHLLLTRYSRKKPNSGVRISEWLDILLKNGLDINFHYQDSETTTLPLLYIPQKIISLESLLSLGADPTLPSYHLDPLIHLAVKNNNLPLFEKLIQKGESFERLDKYGKMPLEYVSKNVESQQKWAKWLAQYEQEKLQKFLPQSSVLNRNSFRL